MDELLFVGFIVLLVFALAPTRRGKRRTADPSSEGPAPAVARPLPPPTPRPATEAKPPSPTVTPFPEIRIHPTMTVAPQTAPTVTPQAIPPVALQAAPKPAPQPAPRPEPQPAPQKTVVEIEPRLEPFDPPSEHPVPFDQAATASPAEFPGTGIVFGRLWTIAPTWRHIGPLNSRKPFLIERPPAFDLQPASFQLFAEDAAESAEEITTPALAEAPFPWPAPPSFKKISGDEAQAREPAPRTDFLLLGPEQPRPAAPHQFSEEPPRQAHRRPYELVGIETIFPGRRFPPPDLAVSEADWRYIGAPMTRAYLYRAGWNTRPFRFLGLPALRSLPVRRSFKAEPDRADRELIEFLALFR